ncbi:type II secretion system F family protein [Actinomyces johnsonii]|nr:type II secretion system F family protein [Actinomyces johnsonii]
MSNVLLIHISGAATLIVGSAALITLSANAGRTAELAQGLGATDVAQRGSTGSILLTLLRRLPFSKPLRRRISSAGLKWDVAITELALTGATVGTFLLSRLLVGHIAGGIFAILIPALFFQWLRRRRDQRVERFIAQLPEVSRVLSNGTSAGMSVERALVLAAHEMSEPAGVELKRTTSQLALGWSLNSALTDLSERMPSRELNVLVRTIIIQSTAGGALASALHDIALALEDRKQLHREVRTAIIGSAFSAYLVPIIGLAAIILMNMMKPGVLDSMASSFIGRIILLAALLCFGIGALLMKLVSRVEV